MKSRIRSAALHGASFVIATGIVAVISATLIGIAITAKKINHDEDGIA